MALTITVVSPSEPSGFSSDYEVAAETTIVVDVASPAVGVAISDIVVATKFGDGSTDLVFFNGNYQGIYVAPSKYETITGGFRLTFRRTTPWPGTGTVGDVGTLIQAIDLAGTRLTEEFYWSLPAETVIEDAPPFPAPAEGVADLVAIALSRMPSQFLD